MHLASWLWSYQQILNFIHVCIEKPHNYLPRTNTFAIMLVMTVLLEYVDCFFKCTKLLVLCNFLLCMMCSVTHCVSYVCWHNNYYIARCLPYSSKFSWSNIFVLNYIKSWRFCNENFLTALLNTGLDSSKIMKSWWWIL